MNETPPISCMCLTYARPHLVEEAVESFLRQDYPGEKELIVLSDFDRQVLRFDHPDVHVINVPKRFHTVGEKRNACAALAAHDLLFVWDDDDIFLSHRLSYSVRMYDPQKRFFKASWAFMLHNNNLGGPVRALFHSGSCFARSLFDEAHGYRHMGSGQDRELETEFERILGPDIGLEQIALEEIYYIYRWGGTQSFHLSGFGKDKPGAKTGNQKAAEYVERQCRQNRVPLGEVRLQPAWRYEYESAVRDYITVLKQAGVTDVQSAVQELPNSS